MRPDLGRWWRRASAAEGLSTFLGIAALTIIANRDNIFRPAYESGDAAANALLIERARSLRLLVGNYSRLGFNHPGPAFLYVQALGERIFGLVPGVATPLNRDVLAVVMLNAAFVTAAIVLLRRHEGTIAALLFAVAMCVQIRATPGLLASTWMPHLYLAPFALFVVALALVLADRDALVALLISTAFLVHGHISFALIAGVPTVVAMTVRRRSVRTWLSRRRTRIASIVTLVLFATPLVIGTFVNGISFWTAYVTSRNDAETVPRSVLDSVVFVARFWRFTPDPSVFGLVVIALLLAAGLGVAELRLGGGTSAWWAAFALVVPLCLLYAYAGIDDLRFTYTGIFMGAAAAVSTAVAVAGALRAVRTPALPARVATLLMDRRVVAVGVAVAIALVTVASYRPSRGADGGAPWMPTAVRAVRAGTTGSSELRLSFANESWPDAVGLMVAMRRTGRSVCIDDANWSFMVTRAHICKQHTGPWLFLSPAAPPAGGTTLYTSPDGVRYTAFP